MMRRVSSGCCITAGSVSAAAEPLKGPTLTIVKVAGNGFVFGAYKAVAWPQQPANGDPDVIVPDPSGTSFIFSLKHKYGDRPFTIPLKDKQRAIFAANHFVGFGPSEYDAAGKLMKWLNIGLMNSGKSANAADANFTNNPSAYDQAYPGAVWRDGDSAPDGFVLDNKTLAGSNCFSCAEIEVFTL